VLIKSGIERLCTKIFEFHSNAVPQYFFTINVSRKCEILVKQMQHIKKKTSIVRIVKLRKCKRGKENTDSDFEN